MENDTPAAPATPVVRAEGTTGNRASTNPSRHGRSGPLLFIIVLALAAALAWWLWRDHREHGTQQADALGQRVDELQRANAQLRSDVDALRARLADSESVNRSVREELLGTSERARALEDAVAHLADERLSGRDTLSLNEAEFVLQLAGERLRLFHDPAAAITAYRLANSALTSAEDPVFASVRQTIAAEIGALEAAQPLETHATLGALAALRGQLASLPSRTASARMEPAAVTESRFARVFGQFVRIRHDAGATEVATRDAGLARSLAVLDLRGAEAALFARDGDAFKAALARSRAGIEAGFDADAAPVRDALATLDRLAAAPMAPALPELGSALRELRNLRTTRALSREAQAPAPGPTP